ncbi:MAG: hypothetical protein ACLGSD_02965 [Acidobacteriota bacterium]
MFYPPIDPGVRAGDSAGEPIVRRIPPPTQTVDAHVPHVRSAIENGRQEPLGYARDAANPALSGSTHEESVTGSLHRLHSAHVQIQRSFLLLAELHDLLRTTMDAIRTSQELIASSDRLITRAQTLGCENAPNGRAA